MEKILQMITYNFTNTGSDSLYEYLYKCIKNDILLGNIRPGEKLHEEMITVTDALDTIDLGRYYVILPSVSFKHSREEFIRHHNAVPVPDGFHYSSDNNTEWETVETMRENIKKYVDPNFEVK